MKSSKCRIPPLDRPYKTSNRKGPIAQSTEPSESPKTLYKTSTSESYHAQLKYVYIILNKYSACVVLAVTLYPEDLALSAQMVVVSQCFALFVNTILDAISKILVLFKTFTLQNALHQHLSCFITSRFMLFFRWTVMLVQIFKSLKYSSYKTFFILCH